MEVTEVGARLVRRYWVMLVVAILVPMAVVAAATIHSPSTYTAHARIIASATIPESPAQAAAIVSQIQAIATSNDVMTAALAAGHLDRSPSDAVKNVTVTGIGLSPVVDLAYTDTSAVAAQQVTTLLSSQVAAKIASVRAGMPTSVQELSDLITVMTSRRAEVQAAGGPQSNVTLADINQVITDLSNDRDKLQLTDSTAAVPTLVGTVAMPQADSSDLGTRLAIAALLGLALGLIFVGANETLRPGVSGASRVARLLGAPTLGTLTDDANAMAEVGRQVRLAGRQASVSVVVVIRADRALVPPKLIERIQTATLQPDPAAEHLGPPSDDVDDVSDTVGAPRIGAAQAQTLSRPAPDVTRTTVMASTTVQHIVAFEELHPNAEGEAIGLVVLTLRSTRLTAIDNMRDLVAASGWPLLGVLHDPKNGRRT